jgi:photosystem II stability/assembly factor-like uncharacterized protein
MNRLRTEFVRRTLLLFSIFAVALCLNQASGSGQKDQKDQQDQKDKAVAAAKSDGTLPAEVIRSLQWRSIGPATMAGRVTAIAVYEADPTTYWIATASGGLVKTTNNGLSFEHQFDRESTVSIGDVAVAQSNKNIVWVGTGEANPRNSASYGDGVYKSTDGGKTWKNMGLKETFQIGKILIHPTNPDIVYVGALGRLYGENQERGLFKTTDGGATWEKILYKDDKTGVIDMTMHPTDPSTIIVALWERKRDGFDVHQGKDLPPVYDKYDPVVRFGPHAGLYKTTDGGKSFTRLTKGLPTSQIGRVGLDWYRKDPKVVFAVVDCFDIGKGPEPKKGATGPPYVGIEGEEVDGGYGIAKVLDNSPASKAGLLVGDLIVGINDKDVKAAEDYRDAIAEFKAGDKLTFKLKRDNEDKSIELTLGQTPGDAKDAKGAKGAKGGGGGGGGKGNAKAGLPFRSTYGGQPANKQDEQGKDGHLYGGLYRSDDGGESWKRINSNNPRPMYFSVVRVDPSDDKYLYMTGIQQSRSTNGGKTFQNIPGKQVHDDGHAWWIDPKDGRHQIVGCDGGFYVTQDRATSWDHLNTLALGQFYHVAVDNKKPYWVYGGLQDNGTWGMPTVSLKGRGLINEDAIELNGSDGFVCRVDASDPDLVYFESQDGNISWRNLRTGERGTARPGGAGGKGAGGGGGGKGAGAQYRWNWNTPFILSSHNSKIFYSAGNFVFKSLDRGKELKIISPEITLTKVGTASALAESPKNPDVLWVGSDDGALSVTKDGGKTWTELSHLVPMRPRCVATIEASRFKEGRAYVAFDAHRSNDDRPYIFVTEDFGQSWAPIRSNLPHFGSTRCLREDVENENLLYCGTEFALFASINRGASWAKINNNLPTVDIHEVAVHPTAGEIVAATHGRSLWILDVSALRQIKPSTLEEKVALFKPHTAINWQSLVKTGGTNRKFVGENPPRGAQIYYYLGEGAKSASLKIVDVTGATVSTLDASARKGLNKAAWPMTLNAGDAKGGAKGGKGGKGGGGGFGGGKGGFGGNAAPSGSYRVVLTVDGKEYSTSVRIENDPNVPERPIVPGDNEPDGDPKRRR